MMQVVPATMDHARAIQLRPGDARELAALGQTMVEAFEASIRGAAWANAYLIDGEVAAIVGLSAVSLLGDQASPWLLTGRPVERDRKLFLRETRKGIDRMKTEFRVLQNYVHAEYAEAIRWLRWLGFEIGEPMPYGPYGAPFCPAIMRTR